MSAIYFTPQSRLDFEILVSEISSSLVNTGSEDVDRVLESSLQRILDLLHIDRAALFEEDAPGTNRMTLTHLKVRPGCGPQERPELTTDSFPWMFREFKNGRQTMYSRIEDLPAEAAVDKETLRRYGPAYSAMAVPLLNDGHFFGILALGIAKEMEWPEELGSRMRVLAHVFAGALIRRKMEVQLKQAVQELTRLKTQLEHENVYLRSEIGARQSTKRIVHQSAVMESMLSRAQQVARTTATVMLSGETGTGKELIATAIHSWSSRARRSMVRVNCGAIPAALIESELFGREKGAYTGALTRQVGRFELANESTIFLDEITELPLELQVKLLRVLQEKEIERLGNPRPIAIDVRVIAATNANLEKAVREGKFREDLYYRLNVFPIYVPPLRERREDIPALAWTIVDEISAVQGKKVEEIDERSMQRLLNYSWPGNVRELRNVIERAMILSNAPVLTIDLHVPSAGTAPASLRLKDMEVQHIRKVLETASWKIRGKNGAAELLGMKPTTLETRMAKLGIVRPRA